MNPTTEKCRTCGEPFRRYRATYGVPSHVNPLLDVDHEPAPEALPDPYGRQAGETFEEWQERLEAVK